MTNMKCGQCGKNCKAATMSVCRDCGILLCPDCGKPTRVAHAIVDGKKARVCKHCGASLDKQAKAAVKKDKKVAKKAAKKAMNENKEEPKC